MSTSSHASVKQFKSPLRMVAKFLFKSRETQKAIVEKKRLELRQAQELLRESGLRERALCKQLHDQRQQIESLQQELTEAKNQPLRLPEDPKLRNHCYGAKMISMCCNLSKTIGFRPAEKALKIFWKYLGLETKLPVFETMRTWLQRVGVARMQLGDIPKKNGQLAWFVDHSCKVGTEKVLAILGIRLKDLPPRGTPLKHQDMIPLLAVPGESWKREDVAKQYKELIKRIGAPLAINSDAAVELQEPALLLKNGKKRVLVQGDPKHKLANIIKSVIGNDKRFVKFSNKLGQARAAIQQTELSHFTPPRQKKKARFMNLQSTIGWASMTLWHLSKPHSSSRTDIKAARMTEKLGWLRDFRKDIQSWTRCLDVVAVTLKFINEQSLYVGASTDLEAELKKLKLCKSSRIVMTRTLDFIQQSEKNLKSLKIKGLRVPMSTEVLESLFGRYKQLEGQHSHNGFTSLLASFAALLRPTTPEEIEQAFAKVSTKEMRDWVKKNLGDTLQSKKNLAYAEFKKATQT